MIEKNHHFSFHLIFKFSFGFLKSVLAILVTRTILAYLFVGPVFYLLFTLILPPISQAATETRIGRYLTVANQSLPAQKDPLLQIYQGRFPDTVETIGEAMNHLLQYSGFSMVPKPEQSQSMQLLLSQPLPLIDRDFGPISLRDGLRTLAGKAFTLVEDPLHRIVSFKLKPSYRKYLHYSHETHLQSTTPIEHHLPRND